MAGQGLSWTRFAMVIASFWPLFLLWAIRGSSIIEDWMLFIGCGALIVIPNLFVLARILFARHYSDIKMVTIENAEDHRDHILIYLIAILLPIYSFNPETWRDFTAVVVALGLMLIIFWLLNLHYMNLFFTILDYKIYTINPENLPNQTNRRERFVIITKLSPLINGEQISMYRISDTIFIDLSK